MVGAESFEYKKLNPYSDGFEYKKEMNPYPDGLPEEVSKAWTERMNDFFRLFLKHHNLITKGLLLGSALKADQKRPGVMTLADERFRTDLSVVYFFDHYQPKPVVGLIIKGFQAEKFNKISF